MASAHLSAKIVSRGSGHSAVAKAAYNAREELDDRRTGETHDYTRHSSKCLFQGIYAPKGAPEWAHDRAQLWNHVEAFEKRRNSQLAQDIDLALPHELTLEQNRYLLQDWVKENVTRKGLIADVAIHAPDRRGDGRNIHAHVMIVLRKLDGSEFTRTKERFDTLGEKQAAQKADLTAMRESWEKLANRHLERHGHAARIDMGRKQDGEATLHMGRHATAQERRGGVSEIGDRNREIRAANDWHRERILSPAEAKAENKVQRLAELAANDRILESQVKREERNQGVRDQIRADIDAHTASHDLPASRAPALKNDVPARLGERGRKSPEIDLGEVEKELRAERAAAKPDRAQWPPERLRGPKSRSGQDAARAAGRGAGMLGSGVGKAAGGALGIVGGLLGAAARAVDGATKSPTPQKRPRSLAEITREAQAKQATKPKEPEKDRDNDRSRFVARPIVRFATAVGMDTGWVIKAKERLIDYANQTGAAIADELAVLNGILFRAWYYGP